MSRIITADPHPLIRSALRQFLEADGHRIVAELADGPGAVHETLALRPQLLILGLALPRLGGLEVIQRLRQHQGDYAQQQAPQLAGTPAVLQQVGDAGAGTGIGRAGDGYDMRGLDAAVHGCPLLAGDGTARVLRLLADVRVVMLR
ncbi:Response regulator receiver domain protein [compost metagenome]